REKQRSQRAQSSLGSVEGIGAGAQAESRGAARSTERRGQGDEISGLLFARSRCLRNDHGRDAQDAGRLDGDVTSALFATAHLGEIQTGGEISSAGAEENPGTLDQQSLEQGMGGTGRGR